ncbi:MAG TPA: hypothetical protein VM939_03015, partial [Gemmatimonadaceae bacterium]|nr:hypothetical protein [Gemmatimonadaceae bacterium]
MKPLSTVAMYSRFVFGLPRFLRRRMTLDDARRILVERIAARERNFLALMKKGVYETPRSPYLFLLKQAGCTQEDLHELVRTIGIEGTLGKLYDAGVHVSFEQFKGREPITRGGETFATDGTSFDNPHLRAHYEKQTSGSTGSATRVMLDLDHIDAIVPYHLIAHEAHGVRGAPTVLWAPELPSGNGVNNIMRSVLMENVVRR